MSETKMNVRKSIELLGFKVKDKVTGAQGVVTSISFDLYGCVQAIVTPLANTDGQQGKSSWYDTNRLVITSKRPVMKQPDLDFKSPPGPAAKPIK